MQLLGVRATLNFQKFKVALNPMYRICLNFAKSCISSCLLKFYKKKKFHRAVFEYKHLKLTLRVFLAGYSVAILCHDNNSNVFTNDWAVF